jgi:prepilin-type N-terminal cleavage/methylation domain-containing protein
MRRCSGLTLIEVLLSLAILAVGEVLVMQALARGASALAAAEHRSTAYAFAAAKLADLEMSFQQRQELKTNGRFGAGRDAFEWQVEAAAQDDQPRLELVTLTVDWRQGPHRYASRFSTVRRVPEEELLP